MRRALEERAGRRGRGRHRRRAPPGWASPGWRTRRSEARRARRPPARRARPSRTVRRAPTGCCATRCAQLLGHRARRPATPWGRRCCAALERSRAGPAADGAAARRRRAGRRAGHAGGGPDRPAVPRRPGGRRRRRPPRRGWCRGRSSSSSRRPTGPTARRSHLLGRVAFATAGRPWAVVVVRRGDAGGFVAGVRHVRVVLGPLPAEVVERLVHRRHRGDPLRPHEVAAIVERAGGQPALRRGGHPARPGLGSLEAAARVGARRDERPDRPAAARRASGPALLRRARPQLPARGARRASSRADDLTLDAATLTALGRLHRGRRRRPGAVPQQPGPRRRLRGARLPGAGPHPPRRPVRCWRTQHRPRRRLPDPRCCTSRGPVTPRAPGATRSWPASWPGGRTPTPTPPTTSRPRSSRADGWRRSRMPSGPRCGRSWASCASSPACSTSRSRPTGALPGCCGTTPWPPPRCSSRQATVHNAHRRFTTRCAWWAGPGACFDGQRGRAARRTMVRLDNLTALVRVEQERPKEARQWAERAMEGAGEIGEHETLVRALMLIDTVDLQLGVPGLGRAPPGGARDLRRARVAPAGVQRSARTSARWPTTPVAGPRRRSGTGPAARWRWRPGAPSSPPRPTSTSPSCSSTWGTSTRPRRSLSSAIRVLRASGAARFLAEGQMQLARVSLGRGRLDEAERRAAEVVAAFRRSTTPRAPWMPPSCRPRRWCAAGACRGGSGRSSTSAERAAGADAAFSMPRTCLQRGGRSSHSTASTRPRRWSPAASSPPAPRTSRTRRRCSCG